jgi:hypothetical protein
LGDAVKWLIALVLILSLHSTGQDLCSVREFYNIAFRVHDPSLRHQQMSMWLTNNAKFCSTQDFVGIWNNLASWAGTADSSEIRSKIIEGYRNAEIREKK